MKIWASVAWFVVIGMVLIVLAIWLGQRRTEPMASPEQTNLTPVVERTPTQPKQPHQSREPVRTRIFNESALCVG